MDELSPAAAVSPAIFQSFPFVLRSIWNRSAPISEAVDQFSWVTVDFFVAVNDISDTGRDPPVGKGDMVSNVADKLPIRTSST